MGCQYTKTARNHQEFRRCRGIETRFREMGLCASCDLLTGQNFQLKEVLQVRDWASAGSAGRIDWAGDLSFF